MKFLALISFLGFLFWFYKFIQNIKKKTNTNSLTEAAKSFSALTAYIILRSSEVLLFTLFLFNLLQQYKHATYFDGGYEVLAEPNAISRFSFSLPLLIIGTLFYFFKIRKPILAGFKYQYRHRPAAISKSFSIRSFAIFNLARKLQEGSNYTRGFYNVISGFLCIFGILAAIGIYVLTARYCDYDAFYWILSIAFVTSLLSYGTLSNALLVIPSGFQAHQNIEDDADEAYQKEKEDQQEDLLREHYGESKDWASDEEIQSALKSPNGGVYIGGNYHWGGKGHILTIGATRAGKGVNLVVPNLLSPNFTMTKTSIVCLDPKGENAAICKDELEKSGYDVHILNPFGVGNLPNSCFNPLDLTDKNQKDVIEFCDMLAEMVIPYHSKGDSTSDHFDSQARTILAAFMLHLLDSQPKEKINFSTLFSWANKAGDDLKIFLAEIALSESYRGVLSSIITGFIQTVSESEKEAAGILSTMKKGLSPFKSLQLQESTEKSDFVLSDITKKPMAVFICLEQFQMAANSVWMRMIVGAYIHHIQRHHNKERKVLFVLDEFPTLGYMKQIEDNMGFIAGYNVTFWVVVQSLVQLQNHYDKSWEVFTANSVIQHFLGIGDLTTANYLSERLPEVVDYMKFEGNVRELKKKLLSPDEILIDSEIITLIAGCPKPASFEKQPYYEHPIFKDRAAPNPFI